MGIFAKKLERKSDPILSDFFRFLDFSRLSDSTAQVLTASILSSAMKSNLVEKPAAVAAAPKSNSSSSQKVKKWTAPSWQGKLEQSLKLSWNLFQFVEHFPFTINVHLWVEMEKSESF